MRCVPVLRRFCRPLWDQGLFAKFKPCNRSLSDMGHVGDFKNQLKVSPVAGAAGIPVSQGTKSPWESIKDPSGGPGYYYWNKETNETTPIGAPKPAHWVEVSSGEAADSPTYWWDPESNSTTALGAPKPHHSQITPAAHQQVQVKAQTSPTYSGAQRPSTFGGMMKTYVLLGVGVSLGSILVRMLLG